MSHMDDNENNSLVKIDIRDVFGAKGALKNVYSAIEQGVGKITDPLLVRFRTYLENSSQYSSELNSAKVLKALHENLRKSTENIQQSKISDHQYGLILSSIYYKQNDVLNSYTNKENIAAHALNKGMISNLEYESGEIDNDWLTMFWCYAEKATNEHVQRIFSDLLLSETWLAML